MKLLPLIFLLLVQGYLFSQNDIDTKHLINKWKVVSFGSEAFSDDETLLMIFEFGNNDTVTIGSQFARSSAPYKLINGNKIEIGADGSNESWEIRKLNDNEFVFWELTSGEVKLVKTDMDFPEPPNEISDFSEPETHSIITDYKGSKKTTKLLIGSWVLKKIGKVDTPEDVNLYIVFNKDGSIEMISNGEKSIESKWELNSERNVIKISGDLEDERWGIKTLDNKKLIIIEAVAGEIVLEKVPKKKKKK